MSDKEKKKKEKPKTTQTPIVLTGDWLDKLNDVHPDSKVLTALFKRFDWPPKVRWWLGRIMVKIEQEAKIYFQSRQEIVDENSEKWDHDGSYESEVLVNKGQVVEYKDGDVKSSPGGQIDWGENEKKVNEEFRVLRDGEIMLSLWMITLDVNDIPKEIPPEEIKLLAPIMEIPDVDKELVMSEDDIKKWEKENQKTDESSEIDFAEEAEKEVDDE